MLKNHRAYVINTNMPPFFDRWFLTLFRRKIWSHKMINESDLVNMVATHLRGEARHALERLYREGLLNIMYRNYTFKAQNKNI